MTLADRLVVVNAGRVEQIGAPLDIYDKPALTFVAAFIGAPPMNLLPAAMGGAAPAAAATIGFRPEDVEIGHAGEGLQLTAEALAIEPVGAESFIHCRIGDATATLRTHGRSMVTPGETIRFVAPHGRLHWFGGDGRRL